MVVTTAYIAAVIWSADLFDTSVGFSLWGVGVCIYIGNVLGNLGSKYPDIWSHISMVGLACVRVVSSIGFQIPPGVSQMLHLKNIEKSQGCWDGVETGKSPGQL